MLTLRVFGIFICVMVSCQLLQSVKAENDKWNSFHSILVNKDKRSLQRETRELSSNDVTKFKSLLSQLLRERKPKSYKVDEEKVRIHNGYKTGEKLKYEDLVRMVDNQGRKTFREADTENPRTSQTAEDLLEEDTHDVHRKPIQTENDRRSFLKGKSLLWSNGIIPFQINKNVDDACREEIYRAIAVFHDNTCIKWEPYSGSGKDHVEFFTGGISSSFVGNIQVSKNGHMSKPELYSQPISIDSRHCTLHVILHEMGHAVGMTHEHSRSDRDQYVTVHWEHVLEGEENHNLAKEDTENHNIPYDYSSLMHYSVYAFSKDGEKTLEYKNTDYEFLGLRENTLSFYDIEDITKAYKCTLECAGRECQNAGYLDHTCSCRCPEYLEGPTCKKVINTENCGGIITLQDQNDQQSIVSPNYPQSYSAGQNCVWLVKAPKGHGIELSSPNFDLPDNSLNRCSHWLEVRFNLIGQPGPLYCGDSLPVIETSSGGESHLLLLRFDSTNQFVDSGKGFNLTIRVKTGFNQSNGLIPNTSDDSVSLGDEINYCELDPGWCYNEGTCVFRNGEVSCLCSDGFSGDFCEHSDHSKEARDKSTQYFAVLYSCHPSTECSIINLYENFTWRMEKQNLEVSPQTGPKGSQAGFSIPFKVTENRDMCFEIRFRRLRSDTPCGVLEVTKHVEGADFGYGGYQYDLPLYRGGCGEGGKIVSSPISSFVGETTTVSLRTTLGEDGEFNIAIENISIIGGYC